MKALNFIGLLLVGLVACVIILEQGTSLTPRQLLHAVGASDQSFVDGIYTDYNHSMKIMRAWSAREGEAVGQDIVSVMARAGRRMAFDAKVISLGIDAGLLDSRQLRGILALEHLGTSAVRQCLDIWKKERRVTYGDEVWLAATDRFNARSSGARPIIAIAVPIVFGPMANADCSSSTVEWAGNYLAEIAAGNDADLHLQLCVSAIEWASAAVREQGNRLGRSVTVGRLVAAIEAKLAEPSLRKHAPIRFLLTMALLAMGSSSLDGLSEESYKTGSRMLVAEGGANGAGLAACFSAWRHALNGKGSGRQVFDLHFSSMLTWSDSRRGCATCVLMACAYTVARNGDGHMREDAQRRLSAIKLNFECVAADACLW